MRLTCIEIEGFRSIKNLSLDFPDNNLLILVGHNNAGKSNIIRAIDLICGETWTSPDRLEDHDFYQRRNEYKINIKLCFDNGNTVTFSSDERWPEYKDGSGRKIYANQGNVKDEFPCTYLAADRTLDKHTAFYDYSLIGKIRKAFHKKAKDVYEVIKEKYNVINDLYEQVDGFKKFKDDFAKYFSEMQADAPVKLSLDFKPFTPSNYFKNMQILATDPDQAEETLDLSELGEGSRNMILLSLLRSYAENFKGGAGILALEEPELFLHPQARRHLFKTLQGIAATGMQVIVSTHSSSFTDLEFFESIAQVYKTPDEELDNKNHTQIRMVSRKDLVEHCKATGVPGSKVTEDNITEFYKNISHPRTNEAFFARVILLVEGDTEELSLPVYLEALDFDCDLYGVSILPVGGKGQIPKYWRLLSKFNAPVISIFDRDDSNNNNSGIAKCFGLEVADIEHDEQSFKRLISENTPNYPIYVFNQDYETAIKASLSDSSLYDRYKAEAKELIKPTGDQCKGQIGRYIARKLVENSQDNVPEFVHHILKDIQDHLDSYNNEDDSQDDIDDPYDDEIPF